MPKKIRYHLSWNDNVPDLEIELYMIRKGEAWLQGRNDSLFNHYMAARKLLWPKRYRHRWTDLIYKEILQNQFTVLMGAASCQKTSHASEFILIDYWANPTNTFSLVSTTTKDKLEDGVWGEIKSLFGQARERYGWLAGHLIDYKQSIATDDVEEDDVRDLRRGIKGKACYTGKQYVGLGAFAGIKQERIRFLADELQFMQPTFLDCLPNMFSNPDVKVIGSGNPRHDPDDQLGMAAEPLDGWASVADITKTTVWNTRFYQSRCVNLIGKDSPNFDVPEGEPEPYPRLIGRRFAAKLEHDYGINSPQVETQVMGRMKMALAHSRVITRELCREHGAHDIAVWAGSTTKIHACDPAYGGGDRCISGYVEFGLDVDGKMILRVNPPHIIKINVALSTSPEDQIAAAIKSELEAEGIEPANSFYDSFGKGTIGFALARKFGHVCPNPIDAGARPTQRPVRSGLLIEDHGKRRLKRCDEHYSKFITEMWFSIRYAIEAGQVRELPVDVMLEGCSREYETVAGDKIEVEPKHKMKERTGKSPDLHDWLACAVEGARQRGFQISNLGPIKVKTNTPDWLDQEVKKYEDIRKSKQLATR